MVLSCQIPSGAIHVRSSAPDSLTQVSAQQHARSSPKSRTWVDSNSESADSNTHLLKTYIAVKINTHTKNIHWAGGQVPSLLGGQSHQCLCLICGNGSLPRQVMGLGWPLTGRLTVHMSSFLYYKNRNSSRAITESDCMPSLCRY